MVNAEKIALAIAKGANNILVHEIPTTGLWLVCEKQINHNWKMTVCKPLGEKYYILGDDIAEADRINLWINLVKFKASSMAKNKDPAII